MWTFLNYDVYKSHVIEVVGWGGMGATAKFKHSSAFFTASVSSGTGVGVRVAGLDVNKLSVSITGW